MKKRKKKEGKEKKKKENKGGWGEKKEVQTAKFLNSAYLLVQQKDTYMLSEASDCFYVRSPRNNFKYKNNQSLNGIALPIFPS